jgi:hypothetical protein
MLSPLHPFVNDVSGHVAEEFDGILRGITPTGEFHIERLQLNRPALVAHRSFVGAWRTGRQNQMAR